MAEIIGYIGRAQTLTAELSTPQTLTASFGGGGTAHGIPAGGEPGQGLIKVSDADYDVKWMSILPEDTASGSVASFPDGADDLPMGVVVDIDPVQDLHGYDNPWPGGGGKNKFDEQFRQGSALDLSNTARVVASKSIYVEQGKTYTFSASNYSAFNYVINSAQADSLPISGSYNYCGAGLDWLARTNTFTATNSGYVFVCVRKPDNSDIVPSDVANVKMQFEESSTATAYAPYSNICPISGWDGAKVTRTGRNLVEDSLVGYNIIANGTFEQTSSFTMQIARVKKGVQYTKTAGDDYFVGGYFTEKPTPSSVTYNNSRIVELANTFTAPIDGYVVFRTASSFATPQLELGSTAHAYEPYTAVTHEIPFSTEVYGGKLNVETGECVVDRLNKTITDFSRFGYQTNANYRGLYSSLADLGIENAVNSENNICSKFKYSTRSSGQNFGTVTLLSTGLYFWDNGAKFANSTEAREYFNALNGVDIVYTLATPITLTLTPVEVRSLLGDNNVWADTGDVSVTYKANIQGYIDKKISAAVAAMS